MTAIPLIYSFWMMLVFYVIHILDESLLGGSFVQKVREHWWPQYSWTKFFWFNAGYLFVMAGSVVLYDRGGITYLFLPIAWAVERFANSLWHVWWTARFQEYSPGLLTSFLIWIQTYFIVAGHVAENPIPFREAWPGLILGLAAAAFISLYIPLVKGRMRREDLPAGA
jgi:hypothetical protein